MEDAEDKIQNQIFGCYFDEGLNYIPCFAIIQFIYTIIVWGVVLSEKAGYALIQLVAFFGHLVGVFIILQNIRANEKSLDDEFRRFWTKMFPLGAFLGIFWSFTPLIICFVSGIRDWFIDDAGKIVVCVFNSIFLLLWINIYIAGEFYRQKCYPTNANVVSESMRLDLNKSIRGNYAQEKEKEEQRKKAEEQARLNRVRAEAEAIRNQQAQQPPAMFFGAANVGNIQPNGKKKREDEEMKFAMEMAERQRQNQDAVTPLQDQEQGETVERDGKQFKKMFVASLGQELWEEVGTGKLHDDEFNFIMNKQDA